MEITVKSTTFYINIYINGLLHLRINKEKFVALRSFKISPDKDPDPFFIEITSDTNKIMYQYDTMLKWSTILKLLDSNL